MPSSWFANGIDALVKGNISLTKSTLRAVLINSTGNANLQFDTWDFYNDLNRTIQTGDIADNKVIIVSTGSTIVGAQDHVNFGSGSQVLTFTTVATGQKAKGILVMHSEATSTLSELICYCSFTSVVNTDGGSVEVTLNASGFARASYVG